MMLAIDIATQLRALLPTIVSRVPADTNAWWVSCIGNTVVVTLIASRLLPDELHEIHIAIVRLRQQHGRSAIDLVVA